jgi:hypothetical protein
MEYDEAYFSKIAQAVYKAVIDTSSGANNAVLIQTGPAFDALMMVAATLVAKDPKFEAPDAVRTFSDSVSLKLGGQIRQIRKASSSAPVHSSVDPNKVH